MALVSKQTVQTENRLSAKLAPTFVDRGCRIVRTADPFGRILGSIDWIRYFFFQVTPQLYARG
jgi:hypothetical protein